MSTDRAGEKMESTMLAISATAIDQGANVLSTPDGRLAAKLDAFGEFALTDACPPGRTADGNEGENLGESNEACFRQDWAGEFHVEHPWLFGDARYLMP